MLHPDYPVVEGQYELTDEWSLHLPERFNRRVEDGDLYIWRPGLTLILAVWGNDKSETSAERLAWIREDMSPKAYDVRAEDRGELVSLSYRLREASDDNRVDALYAFVVASSGHLQVAFYFDDESDCELARRILGSVAYEPTAE
jgi:hypothetical protein